MAYDPWVARDSRWAEAVGAAQDAAAGSRYWQPNVQHPLWPQPWQQQDLHHPGTQTDSSTQWQPASQAELAHDAVSLKAEHDSPPWGVTAAPTGDVTNSPHLYTKHPRAQVQSHTVHASSAVAPPTQHLHRTAPATAVLSPPSSQPAEGSHIAAAQQGAAALPSHYAGAADHAAAAPQDQVDDGSALWQRHPYPNAAWAARRHSTPARTLQHQQNMVQHHGSREQGPQLNQPREQTAEEEKLMHLLQVG